MRPDGMPPDGRRRAGEPEDFESLRPLLFSIAYRMLSSVSDAEDIVQDAFLRYERARQDEVAIESPKAYLSAIVTRLAIDQLRSARVRRETYVGEWLPEPLVTDGDAWSTDPAAHVEEAESLSMAFLLVLDRLDPVERAVFLLHDVFGYEYPEIAGIVGKSEVNCRQIASRARRHVQAEKPRFDASRRERDLLAGRFFAAVTNGDMPGLVELLAADVVVYGDGGGKAPQWATAITGADRVARLFAGLGRQMAEYDLRLEFAHLNGQPGAIVRDHVGEVTNVFVLDILDGVVQTVRSVINPDKLRHLGPVADVRALARAAREDDSIR
jgi:RNA polymerase sigma-70 factor (ECF subfamily)